MERMVLEVALKGDVASLKKLLDDYPLLLEESMTSVYSYTPLHVAAMLGYEDLTHEILRRKPELAKELNSKQSSPLHLAAAMGHAGVVRALLLVDRGMLKGRDRDGLTPFHLAAVKGRVEVLKELMSDDHGEICSSELSEVMEMDGEKLGENILQMCVKYGQLEALKLLVEMIAERDGEAVKFLVQPSRIQVNGENNGKEMEVIGEVVARMENSKEAKVESEKYKKKKESWVNEMREGLMVVASLLATMTFQAIVSPPGGVMQVTEGINQTLVDDTVIFSSLFDHTIVLSGNLDNNAPAPAPTSESMMTTGIIGKSVMSYYKPLAYKMFVAWNTLSFFASLSVILLLISGLPLHRKFFMYVLMIAMWWSISAAAASYLMCLQMITSSNNLQTAYNLTTICAYFFDTVSFVIVIGHIIMVTVKLIKWLPTALFKLKKKKKNSSSSMEHQV